MKTRPARCLGLLGILVMVGLVAGACSAGAAPAPPTPTLAPDAPVTSPPDGGGDPGPAQPSFVVPQPGQLDVRPVTITALTPIVDGRQVTVQADWVSGIEPCYVLDHVDVSEEGATFTIGLFEGSSEQDVACIEIAVYKSTLIDLGELDPGSYIVQSADGSTAPASFTVE
jgi:hypothetical protein